MTRSFASSVVVACIAYALAGPPASAMMPKRDLGGRMQAEVDGKTVHFPSLKTDIIADVTGDLANVTIVQTFVNPAMTSFNATYLFPLNEQAAVHAMEMQVGDELVVAEIRRREAARQTFEQGKREGKAAALLEHHRPNAQVPVPMVEGVGPQAYGRSAANGPGPQVPRLVPIGGRGSAGTAGNSFGGQFSGGSTPEPEHLAGLLVIIVTLLAAARRRQFA